ncbi:hypothetical protein [Afipia carboxidovorans]|nr:hypothetical protein CRBSH125_11230 [Afipia carboxidovorans]
MPSLRFEKILRRGLPPSEIGVEGPMDVPLAMVSKRRGLIVELLDRLTEARLQRDARRIGYTEGDVTRERTRGF